MHIKYINQFSNIHGTVDAIMIVNSDHIVEFSAIVGPGNELMTEDVVGMNIYDIYQNLNEENSTHGIVLRTGKPVINEKQIIVMKNGQSFAINTSTFPIEDKGRIIGTIDISFDLLYDEKKKNDKLLGSGLYCFDNIITRSHEMIQLKEKCAKIAVQDTPVMFIGDSGTGKELFVESVHCASKRKDKPFISLNCAAVPESLMESTLFGTVKGSFTGAENKKGLFELANGGTLFLDELNSMPMDMQAKLLKAVEEQRFMRIGGEKYINVDVRILSAMNTSPYKALEENKLRRDLYYRLGVVLINIPLLKDRKEDIPLLVDHFIKVNNKRMKKNIKSLNEVVMKAFMYYDWPGNVRELRNIMESAFSLVDENVDQIKVTDIPDHLMSFNFSKEGSYMNLDKGLVTLTEEFEKDIIVRVLSQSKNVTDAAETLKMSRQALKYKLQKYAIDYRALLHK